MRGVRFVQVVCLILSLLVPAAAGADELRRLYTQILRDPTNSELNFRYARLAEERGELRKALAAYERILLNEPNHPDVRAALQRIRRQLQPNVTQIFTEFGAGWQSNPRRTAATPRSDGLALGRVLLRDERALGPVRFRSIGTLAGDVNFNNGDLNYGYAGGLLGPIFDLTPTIAAHAGLGGAISYFSYHRLYSEATAALTFESYLEGAHHTVRVRGGYRDYDDFFPVSQGFYADVVGRFSFPRVLGGTDLLILSPWVRWSGINGVGFSVTSPGEMVQPGRYIEYGGRLEYYRRMLEWLTLGGGVALTQRDYAASTNAVTGVTTLRRDFLVVPTAAVIVHHLLGFQGDVRTEYRYEHNRSNVAVRNYINHLVTMMLVNRF